MGLTNPSRGVIDFDDWRSLEAIYEAAKQAGIFVVLRPGEFGLPSYAMRGIWLTPGIEQDLT